MCILKNSAIGIDSSNSNRKLSLSAKDLYGVEGENILAGEKREFRIPWPDELSDGDLNAVLSFDKQ